MQAMAPHPGIGCSKVLIVDFQHGVVVPEPDVGYADADLWDEVSVLTQATFVEIRDLAHGYVQAAQESTVQIGGDHLFPLDDFVYGRIVTVIGTKKDMPDGLGVILEISILKSTVDVHWALKSYHEQCHFAVCWCAFYFLSQEKMGIVVSGPIHHHAPYIVNHVVV
jgi:hypothetical protein